MRTLRLAALLLLLGSLQLLAAETTIAQGITAEAIENASLEDVLTGERSSEPDPAMVKLQVLLDRAGASPGVIDGINGENVAKAIAAFETMSGLAADGVLDADMLEQLSAAEPVMQSYVIADDDFDEVVGPVPEDYSEMAEMAFVGWETVAEKLAERFHMDEDLLVALNPGADYAAGDEIIVVDPGPPKTGEVESIEADKSVAQVRAYGPDGELIAAYPATIGSAENPSPAGSHAVAAVAPMPEYNYNPDNFQQGDNTEPLTIPPGPNGPVGSMWIDLSKPSFGIHGTPEPSRIDKTASHGCVRLTNWDAEELAAMVTEGIPVTFVE